SQSERVAHTITAYMDIFAKWAGLNHEAVLTFAERYKSSIADYAPHLLEEMHGIAEGAGRDLREIVAINARTELMYGVTQPPECTSIGISTIASADGHIRVAQNWDWRPTLAGSLILWVLHRTEGPDILTLTEAGMVVKIGINSSGLAMCINLLMSDTDHAGPAAPMHVILRHVLEEAHSVKEAVALINMTERCTSCFHMLVDCDGSLAGVEATPTGQHVLRSANGVLTHTNHCVCSGLFIHDKNAREFPETLARGERAQYLANEGKIDEVILHSILADHATAPGSICLHVEPGVPPEDNSESIASIIFDLTAGTVDIAEGPPCENAYRRITVEDYLRVTSYQQTSY
ncbi:MAG TPA: C45 family peptidase, partial [Ktedonobacteraceae bacterium]|nr:C45 family peptidase [Ktedonobacteraceae bacterium]